MSCFLGLAAARVWIQGLMFGSYLKSDDGVFSIVANLFYGLTMVVAALLVLRVRRRVPGRVVAACGAGGAGGGVASATAAGAPCEPTGAASLRTCRAIGVAAFVLMAVTPMLAAGAEATGLSLLRGLAMVLTGVGGAFAGGMWVIPYQRLGLRRATAYAFGSLALGSLGGLLLGFVPEPENQYLCVLMAPVATLCYGRALRCPLDPAAPSLPAPVYDRGSWRAYPLMLAGLAVFGFALGISRGFPYGSPVPMTLATRVIHQVGVIALAGFVLWWTLARGRRLSFSLLWRMEILVVGTGLLVLMLAPGTYTHVAVAIINIADSFMLGVLWITMYDLARHSSLHPLALYGFAWAARVLARDLGRVLSIALAATPGAANTGVGLLVFALSVSMAVLLSDGIFTVRAPFAPEPAAAGGDRTAPATPRRPLAVVAEPTLAPSPSDARVRGTTAMAVTPPVAPAGGAVTTVATASDALDLMLGERAGELRARYGLTERETQVATLIARGHSKQSIAEQLGVKENTVRTHAKNAYAKLGVQSRQQLLELFRL